MWLVITIVDSTDNRIFSPIQKVLLDSTGLEYSSSRYFHSWLPFTHHILAHSSPVWGFSEHSVRSRPTPVHSDITLFYLLCYPTTLQRDLVSLSPAITDIGPKNRVFLAHWSLKSQSTEQCLGQSRCLKII